VAHPLKIANLRHGLSAVTWATC